MKLSVLFAFASTCVAAAALPITGTTGGGQPFDNMQPSLAVTQSIVSSGIFPGQGGGSAQGDTLGFVFNFAGNYAPGDTSRANGQILPIQTNQALFSIMGTTYGGNGVQTFMLPNLQGRTALGSGAGPGLTPRALGSVVGSSQVALTTAQIPAHSHSLSGGGTTGTTGGGQSFDNTQSSLVLRPLIATQAAFVGPNAGGGAAFIGQVAWFAGNYNPAGWQEADGSLISIAQNTALFSVLGTTYGGNGLSNFALPDLRGRIAVGVDATHPLGMNWGEESTVITGAQMPAHDHTVPGGGNTGMTGGNAPVNNDQPSLALHYIISLTGVFPTADGHSLSPSVPTLGEIALFAGNYAPNGWAFADGQLMAIAQDQALFAILGTTYGGNGLNTFALPDFRGLTLIGADNVNYFTGGVYGSDANYLSVANLPAHDHTLPIPPPSVPEPLSLGLMVGGLAGLGALRRKKRS